MLDSVRDRKSEIRSTWGSLHGCTSSVKNVCLQHRVSVKYRRAMETLIFRVQAWVDKLSAEAFADASELLFFVCPDFGPEVPSVVAVLLVLAFKSPKAQIWANCGLTDAQLGHSIVRLLAIKPFCS